jgi:hypothetical protein
VEGGERSEAQVTLNLEYPSGATPLDADALVPDPGPH